MSFGVCSIHPGDDEERADGAAACRQGRRTSPQVEHRHRPHGPNPRNARTIALAKHPNVHVKLTLAPECSSASYPYRNIHGALRNLIEAFTPPRCFWGTDLSVMLTRSTCTYPQAVTMFTEEMDFLTADDKEWIMGRGLAECLPWPV